MLYDMVSYMSRKLVDPSKTKGAAGVPLERRWRPTPGPESLAQPTQATPVSFRLSEPYHDALLILARRARVGHSTLARRIVEHYIKEHAPRTARERL